MSHTPRKLKEVGWRQRDSVRERQAWELRCRQAHTSEEFDALEKECLQRMAKSAKALAELKGIPIEEFVKHWPFNEQMEHPEFKKAVGL